MYVGPSEWFKPSRRSREDSPESGEYMTTNDLRARLSISSPKLVEEVLKTTERMLKSDEDRISKMESKAAIYHGSFGLVLSVLFSLGASTLLPHPEYLSRAGNAVLVLCSIVLLSAMSSGFAFAAFSVAAVRIKREWGGIEPLEVLNAEVVRAADVDDAEVGVRDYRRYLIAHYFMISQVNNTVYRRRIAWIRRAQHAYAAFLLSILFGAVLIVVAALKGG